MKHILLSIISLSILILNLGDLKAEAPPRVECSPVVNNTDKDPDDDETDFADNKCIYRVQERSADPYALIRKVRESLILDDQKVYGPKRFRFQVTDHEISIYHPSMELIERVLKELTALDRGHWIAPEKSIVLTVEFLSIREEALDNFKLGLNSVKRQNKSASDQNPNNNGFSLWDSALSLIGYQTSSMMWSVHLDNSITEGWQTDYKTLELIVPDGKFVHAKPSKQTNMRTGDNIFTPKEYETGLSINGTFSQDEYSPDTIKINELSVEIKNPGEEDNLDSITDENKFSNGSFDIKVGETRVIYKLDEIKEVASDSSGFLFWGDKKEKIKVVTIISIRPSLRTKASNNTYSADSIIRKNAKKYRPSASKDIQDQYKYLFENLASVDTVLGSYEANNFGTQAKFLVETDQNVSPALQNTYIKLEVESPYIQAEKGSSSISSSMYLSDLERGHNLPLIDPSKLNPNNKRAHYKVKVAFDDLYLNEDYSGIYGAEYTVIYNLNLSNIHSEIYDFKLIYDKDYIKGFKGYEALNLDGSSSDDDYNSNDSNDWGWDDDY